MESHGTRMLRITEVCRRVGVSKSQIHRLIVEAKFPSPIRIGKRISAWIEAEVEKWLAERIAFSRSGE